jgi:hypothetical protein
MSHKYDLTQANTWTQVQTFSVDPVFPATTITITAAEANDSITPIVDGTYTFDLAAPNTTIAITTVKGIITNITIT